MSRSDKNVNREGYDRRTFLSKSATGLLSLGVMGASRSVFAEDPQKAEKKILYRQLGNTGISMPIVNMGVMNADNPELVRKSYELGVRHFDTAAGYQRGANERMIGDVMKEMKIRDKVIIGTKVYIPHQRRASLSPKQAKEAYLKIANESLERLQTDYVDILYSHNVSTLDWLNNPGIIEALQTLKEQKKVRFIGFSTHSNMNEMINEAMKMDVYEVVEAAFNYAMSDDTEYIATLKKAAAHGIGLVAMKTQCMQYWYREQAPESAQKFYEGSIMHTAVLKWVMRHPFISTAIPGYTTYPQMEEDFSVAYGLEYTDEEKKFLQDREVKLSMLYCKQCGQCRQTCSKGADIPTLMRTHMYAKCYGNLYQARDAYDEISADRNLTVCASCDTCSAKCVREIPIQKRIDELKTMYV